MRMCRQMRRRQRTRRSEAAGQEKEMGRTGAVIPAAGVSYHGDAFRPLLPFEDTTVARHLVSLLKREGVDPIVVVTGYRAAELEEHLEGELQKEAQRGAG